MTIIAGIAFAINPARKRRAPKGPLSAKQGGYHA